MAKKSQDVIDAEELNRARGRIGRRDDECMRWLLRWTYADLDHLSEGDWLNLRYEYVAFSIREIRIEYSGLMIPKGLLPTREDIQKAQAQIREDMDCLFSRRPISITRPAQKIVFEPIGEEDWRVGHSSATMDIEFRYVAISDMTICIQSIIRCKECNVPFLPERSTKEYCSARCQTRVAVRRFRQGQGALKAQNSTVRGKGTVS